MSQKYSVYINAFVNQLHGEGVTEGVKYFCPLMKKCNLGGQLGDKMGENLQISKLKIKNLQIRVQLLMLEIKRFTGYVCR